MERSKIDVLSIVGVDIIVYKKFNIKTQNIK